jgi:hypothetical protein
VKSTPDLPPREPGFEAVVTGELDLSDEAAGPGEQSWAVGDDPQLETVARAAAERTRPKLSPTLPDVVSRSPEAVGNRMSSLADGMRRARQRRAREYAGHGQTTTVLAQDDAAPENGSGG